MADPDRNRCHSRSANRAGTTAFDIEATIPPDRFHCVTIFIKVTGERGDTRSRSASPTPSTAARAPNEKGSPRLPIGVHIDAVPWLNRRQGKIEYWARVRPDHIAFDALADRVLSETGQQARNLAFVEMGRRVAEQDVGVGSLLQEDGWLLISSLSRNWRNISSTSTASPHPPRRVKGG